MRLDILVDDYAELRAAAYRQPPDRRPGKASQEEARLHALAVIEACTAFAEQLDQRADRAVRLARNNRASYTEIGERRGVTRQAARQAIRRQQLLEEEEQRKRRERLERRRAADPDVQDDWQESRDHIRQQREDRWPPRTWQHRAPAGLHTITLVDGPAADRTERVPAGDDAFIFVDHCEVFHGRHERYARYSPVSPASDQYRFTGEYFVRWAF